MNFLLYCLFSCAQAKSYEDGSLLTRYTFCYNAMSKKIFFRNGGYDDSALIGVYCGTKSPGTLITHGNQFYMKFHSDPYVNERGFLMEYDGTLTGSLF